MAFPRPEAFVWTSLACYVLLAVASAAMKADEPPPGESPTEHADPFADFDDEAGYPGQSDLRAILEEVPGERCEIVQRKRRDRPVTTISGLFRLKLPWPEEGALRLSFWEPDLLQLHLWDGTSGVTLRYYRDFHRSWAAYGASRQSGEPGPSRLELWTTDEGRYRRMGPGTVEVQYRQGRLILARGDLCLLSVPMRGPPSEVFLRATAQVRGLAMVRSPVEPEPPRLRPVLLQAAKPAELAWVGSLPQGTSLEKLPEGQVELRAAERTQEAQAGIPVGPPGLYEYTFEVENPDPGTGIYLGDQEGKHLCRIGFFRDRESGRTTFGLLPPWQREIDRSYDTRRQIVPYAARRQWFRIVYGAGIARLWISPDGAEWRQPLPAALPVEGPCTTTGLYCFAHEKPRAIRLCGLEVRRLDALESLVPDAVRQQAGRAFASQGGSLVKAKDLKAWEESVAASIPPGAAAADWWQACALGTLAWGVNASLGQPLLDRLLDHSLAATGELREGVRVLDDAALLYSADWPAVDRFTAQYKQFGRRLALRGEADVLPAISGALARSPFWAERALPVFDDELVRHELVALVGDDRWAEAAGLGWRLQYWATVQEDEPPVSEQALHVARWAAAQAAQFVPQPGRDRPSGVPLPWRHPLVEQSSREGYNVLSEFDAALAAKAYREACQVIASSAAATGLGLLPDRSDARLWRSLPLAIDEAMRAEPALRQTMIDEFGPLGELRVKRAIADDDPAAAELAALQLHGTAAAAEAHQWLGDRDLAHGRFAEAFDHYRRGAEQASDEQRGSLAARLRLAGALAGGDVGSPVSQPVQIGKRRLSPDEFEQLVAQARQAHASSQSHTATAGRDCGSVRLAGSFAPGRYEARPWSHLDGRRVKRPYTMPDRGLDWAGRQTAVLVTDRLMLLSNQLDQVALDLSTGQEVWAERRALDAQFQQWALERMRPVVYRDRVLVRRLASGGPELAALDLATGRRLWSSQVEAHVASDPMLVGDDVLVLTVAGGAGETLTLGLALLDVESGRVLHRAALADFRDLWHRRLSCQATIAGAGEKAGVRSPESGIAHLEPPASSLQPPSRIVATAGGCVLSADLRGRVDWLRRQVWVPPPGEAYHQAAGWCEQVHDPPLVADGRVFATQPGVWGVECLDLQTGRLIWRRAVAGLVRLVGLTSGRLIVELTDGVLALDCESGKTLWVGGKGDGRIFPGGHELAPAQENATGPFSSILACHRQRQSESGQRWQFVLEWLDGQTGAPLGQTVLNTPDQPEPWLGPWVVQGGRRWVLFGAGQDPATRDVLELTPAPPETAPVAP